MATKATPKPAITKELLIGFAGKRPPAPGQIGGDASFKVLAWDNKELFRDEPKWLHYVDSYEIVLLITAKDDHLAPSVQKLFWDRRLRLKSVS